MPFLNIWMLTLPFTNFDIQQLFDQTLTKESNDRVYDLNAVIAYYGKHYSTFCYHGNHQEWVYLDDANVRKVDYCNPYFIIS